VKKQTGQKVKIGHRYGNWRITSEAERVGGDIRYLCQCDCGTVKQISAISLRNGSSTNCGCIPKQRSRNTINFELQPTQPHIRLVLDLISQGYLPPADQFNINDGAPAWTLASLAKILGIGYQELINHLIEAGSRFNAPRVSQVNEFSATS
jgi:hypothetical protein